MQARHLTSSRKIRVTTPSLAHVELRPAQSHRRHDLFYRWPRKQPIRRPDPKRVAAQRGRSDDQAGASVHHRSLGCAAQSSALHLAIAAPGSGLRDPVALDQITVLTLSPTRSASAKSCEAGRARPLAKAVLGTPHPQRGRLKRSPLVLLGQPGAPRARRRSTGLAVFERSPRRAIPAASGACEHAPYGSRGRVGCVLARTAA